MSKKLAIKGHPTRGKEVIDLLKMLGGTNPFSVNNGTAVGNKVAISCYYISENTSKYISWDYIGPEEIDKYKIFTLEEFLEKYPFKIGDRVLIPEYESEVRICDMSWDGYEIQYMVYRCDEKEWYTAEELREYNAEFLVNKEIGEELTKQRNKRLLDQLYENGLKAMFKEHDIVVCETKDKRNKWICEYKSHTPELLKYYKGTYVICSGDPIRENLLYDSSYDILSTDTIRLATPGEITKFERMVDKCINNECIDDTNPIAECKKFGQDSYALKIADGYKFFGVDENGDIIVQQLDPYIL